MNATRAQGSGRSSRAVPTTGASSLFLDQQQTQAEGTPSPNLSSQPKRSAVEGHAVRPGPKTLFIKLTVRSPTDLELEEFQGKNFGICFSPPHLSCLPLTSAPPDGAGTIASFRAMHSSQLSLIVHSVDQLSGDAESVGALRASRNHQHPVSILRVPFLTSPPASPVAGQRISAFTT
jgi:hypothetical protein